MRRFKRERIEDVPSALERYQIVSYETTLAHNRGKFRTALGVFDTSAYGGRQIAEPANLSLSSDGSGNVTMRYLFGLGVDDILARTDSTGKTLWYLTDVRGSVRGIADLSLMLDELVDSINYDPYGNVISETAPAFSDRFKYTGREYDANLGLYDYRNRWYDPKAGTFVEQDPIGFAAGDVNMYRYVGNSPTNWVDPFGLREADLDDGDRAELAAMGYCPPPRRAYHPPSLNPNGEAENQALLNKRRLEDDLFASPESFVAALGDAPLGLLQGGANVLNAGTDILVDMANAGIFVYNAVGGAFGRRHYQYRDKTDWSHGLFRGWHGGPVESDATHGQSRAFAGFGVGLLSMLGGAGMAANGVRFGSQLAGITGGGAAILRNGVAIASAGNAIAGLGLGVAGANAAYSQFMGGRGGNRDNMAAGRRDNGTERSNCGDRPRQNHHYATDKHRDYTPQMENLAKRYKLKLDGEWNKEILPHLGRHPNAYHEFVLEGMERAAREAKRDRARFLELYERYVKGPVRRDPNLLRKEGWF